MTKVKYSLADLGGDQYLADNTQYCSLTWVVRQSLIWYGSLPVPREVTIASSLFAVVNTDVLKLFFSLAAQTCQGVPPKYQALPGVRIRACQEAGHDYCPIHKVNVLSESHCWKLCESLTSCCRLFTYNAKLGHCYIYDQDFYWTWTSVDLSDSNWTSYYKQRDGNLGALVLM